MPLAARPHPKTLSLIAMVLLAGCGSEASSPRPNGSEGSDEALGTATTALLADNKEVDQIEATLETALEATLGGLSADGKLATVGLKDTPAVIATAQRIAAAHAFTPAGCFTSSANGNLLTHTFNNCISLVGLLAISGTVQSSWSLTDTSSTVHHEARGFKINGTTVDHDVFVTYTTSSRGFTLVRKAIFRGTTESLRSLEHTADYTTTWDSTTKCTLRNGTSHSVLDGTGFRREILNYERCSDRPFACPKSGTWTLKSPTAQVDIRFPGGPIMNLSLNGLTQQKPLLCFAP